MGAGPVGAMLIRRLTSTLMAIAVSAIVLWWLLADGIVTSMIEALRTAALLPLALGALLAIAIQGLRAWRFAILTAGSPALPAWTMIGIATKLVLFNFLLPFKLGELSFPLMMRRAYGTPFGEGAGILILCRLLDFGVVAAFILLTSAWLLDPAIHGWNPPLIGALGVITLVTPPLLADRIPALRLLIKRWPSIDRLAGQLSLGASMMRAPGPKLLVLVLTLLIWIMHATIAWLVVLAIGAGFDFLSMIMASAASNLAFALPISGVAGLGPPQAAWATMLHLAGHDWPPAITSALLCHGLLLVTLSLLGAAFWVGQSMRGPALVDDQGPASSAGGR